ncbi:MAG TPA: hypothetical protein VMH00_17585 [Candidatus Limnocylindrales bacterium]|nr:hypothetical protein [Candidatus Limnocylindrales bacterium]
MAPHEDKEAISGLLRQSLAAERGAGVCPEPDMLAAYFERSLEADEMAAYDAHFSRCTHCREQLAGMVRAEPKAAPQHKKLWLLDWRLLSAVTAAMVLLTVWVIRRPTGNPGLGTGPSAPSVTAVKPQGASPAANLDAKTEERAPAREIARAAASSPVAPSLARLDGAARKDRELEKSANASEQRRDRNNQQAQNRNQNQEQNYNGGVAGAMLRNAPVGHGAGGGMGANQQQAQLQAPLVVAGAATAPQPSNLEAGQVTPAPLGGPVPAPPAPANEADAEAKQALRFQAAAPTAAPSLTAKTEAVNAGMQAEVTPGADAGKEKSKKTSLPVVSTLAEDRLAVMQTLDERSTEKIISTPNPAVRWRITKDGFVERSEDSGATWHGQQPYPDGRFTGGAAPSEKICWLVGRDGLVLVTKDAVHWEKLPPPTSADLITVSAKNASSATVTAADGQRFVTHNDGKKWKPER